MFPAPAASLPPPALDHLSDWPRFATLVAADPALFATLQTAPDSETFTALAVRLGSEHGFTFTASDAQAALQTARRSWIERNLT